MKTDYTRIIVSCLFGLAVNLLALLASADSAIAKLGTGRLLTWSNMHVIKQAIAEYQKDKHTLPTSLNALQIKGRYDRDAWNRPIIYTKAGTRYTLTSYGMDGKPGGVGLDTDFTLDNPRPKGSRITFPQYLMYVAPPELGFAACISGGLAGFLCFRVFPPERIAKTHRVALLVQFAALLLGTAIIATLITVLHVPTGH
ncbi:MAG: type II secretion system protein GspG [Armatimonadetes bacterium]|nr:type II secretion system protein GspG [Armatimonadota bacterium]